MVPKRATRSNIAPETTNTTSVTNAQLQAMINQGVTAALATCDANTNGVDSHNSGTGARRNERATREGTYPDFILIRRRGLMSDSDESEVTYTEAPPSPDYVPGPEEPEQAPPSPDYVLGPEHADDEIIAEDTSPTAQSPDYVLESDPKADPEEDDDEDPKEDPVDYPADGGDDGDDEEGSSEDDEDDDMDTEADDEEEEEHPAPADSVVVALPATDPFETDEYAATPPPHPAYRVTARISIPALVPTPVWFDAEVVRLLAMSTPPSSPLSPWSSPLPQIPSPPLPQIPSPLLPVSSPVPVLSPSPPASLICLLGYRAAMIKLRAEAASTSHSLPLPPHIILSHTRPDAPSSGTPPLHLLSTDHREDSPEVTLPP
ncbi:hypothetical protein Tco_0743435 [Tanacetum coccineum]